MPAPVFFHTPTLVYTIQYNNNNNSGHDDVLEYSPSLRSILITSSIIPYILYQKVRALFFIIKTDRIEYVLSVVCNKAHNVVRGGLVQV